MAQNIFTYDFSASRKVKTAVLEPTHISPCFNPMGNDRTRKVFDLAATYPVMNNFVTVLCSRVNFVIPDEPTQTKCSC